jgi:hypothetical protein
MVEIKVHIQGPRTRRVFNLISNVKINQLNSVKYNDARDDAHVCAMTRLINLGCYKFSPVGKISSRDLTSLRIRY